MTRNNDGGSASVELAVLTPVILAVLALMIAAGRLVTAHAAIDYAATAAARSASLARNAPAAQAAAHHTATSILAAHHLHCNSQIVSADTAAFATRPGTTATVTATASCTVPLADLLLPGLPGSVPLQARFASTLDPYRMRQ